MATLTAIGFAKPADLAVIHTRYLDTFVPLTPERIRAEQRAAWRARAMRHVEAHKHLVPIPPPRR